MTTRIRFLGVAAYEIVGPTFKFLIDPFLTGNPVAPVQPDRLETPDFILVSHAAFDHLGDTAVIARRTGAPVVCGSDVRAQLVASGVPVDQIRATVWGIVIRIGGADIRPVESHHWSQTTLPDGHIVSGVPMGFVVETEPGVRVYHSGDSAIFGDMRLIAELYKPTVGLIGCAQPRELVAPGPGDVLTGEMSPDEAALAARLLGVKLAVASHYLHAADSDVERFLALVGAQEGGPEALSLEASQTLVVTPDRHWTE